MGRSAPSRSRFVVLLLLLLLMIVGCKREPGETRASNVETVRGMEYHRIVSLAPNMTESLFLVGAGDRVVGRTLFCDFPEEVKAVPIVPGGVYPDLERLVELKPDLVVTLGTLATGLPQEFLKENGIALYWSRVETADDVARTLRELGELTGTAEKAGQEADRLMDEVKALASDRCDRRVLFIHGHRPLVSAGKDSWGDQLLALAGVRNAAGELDKKYPVLDMEQVVALKPDFVVDTSFAQERPTLDAFWEQFDAQDSFKVIYLSEPSLLRPGPRVVEAAKLLREQLAKAGACR